MAEEELLASDVLLPPVLPSSLGKRASAAAYEGRGLTEPTAELLAIVDRLAKRDDIVPLILVCTPGSDVLARYMRSVALYRPEEDAWEGGCGTKKLYPPHLSSARAGKAPYKTLSKD